MTTDAIIYTQGRFIQRFKAAPCVSYSSPPSSWRQACASPSPRSYHWRRDSKRLTTSVLRRGHETKGNDQRRKNIDSVDDRELTKEMSIMNLKTALWIRSDVYAGSAFSQSPAPSSLPLPTFSRKKEGIEIVDDAATKDLMRLLRIG